jgi:hypothetical protein
VPAFGIQTARGASVDSAVEWPLDRPTLQRFACRVAGRNLTREEWNDLLPDRPYRPVCSTPNARTRDDTDG